MERAIKPHTGYTAKAGGWRSAVSLGDGILRHFQTDWAKKHTPKADGKDGDCNRTRGNGFNVVG